MYLNVMTTKLVCYRLNLVSVCKKGDLSLISEMQVILNGEKQFHFIFVIFFFLQCKKLLQYKDNSCDMFYFFAFMFFSLVCIF